KSQSEVLEGTFEGIGMEYFSMNDTLLVVGVITNGPADKGGFKVGDRILKIGKRDVAGTSVSKEEVAKLMRGKRGSVVSMVIERASVELPGSLRGIRDQIKVCSVDVG